MSTFSISIRQFKIIRFCTVTQTSGVMTYEIVGLSSFKVQQLLHPLHNCKAMSSTSTKHALISKKYNSAVSLVATWKIPALPSWLGNGCRRFLAVAW